nr:hypothetical protein [bacterium]
NDDTGEANVFPALPFTGFTGNVGLGGNYDGDSADFFTFSSPAGQIVKFTITPDEPFAFLEAYVSDSGGNRTVGGAEWDPGTGVVTAYVLTRPNDVPDYFLQVVNNGAETDYSIDGEQLLTYMEVEDNDDDGEATVLPEFFNFFSGNVGTGGGNDGDALDIFTFDANQGEGVLFQMFYDEASGAVPTVEIRDSDGDLLSSMFDDGQGTVVVITDNPFDGDDVAPYFLDVSVSGGFSDYFLTRSMN